MLQGEALGRLALGEFTASTALSLEAGQGSYSITWQSVQSTASLAADAGSIELTAQSVVSGVSLPADQGSYAIAGQDAGLIAAHILTTTPFIEAEPVQFGFAALGDASLGQLASRSARTFSINWQSAASSYAMAADYSTISITGQNATLFIGSILTPISGTYSLTGYPAHFHISMPALTGVVTLTGSAADTLVRIPKIRAFPRVGNPAFCAVSRGRDPIKIRAFGG